MPRRQTYSINDISLINKRESVDGKEKFHSAWGIIFSCFGSVVGTGNMWRFPRICVTNSGKYGGGCFLMIWLFFLITWSIPVILSEYTLGRYSRCGPLLIVSKFLRERYVWMGGFVVANCVILSSYYNVVVGWCLYYVGYTLFTKELPDHSDKSEQIFNNFIGTYWMPLLCHGLILLIIGGCLFGGLKWLEKANNFLVPSLLVIVFFTLIWSLMYKYAYIGIQFMFTPSVDTLMNAKSWIDAACQNAFDTGAGFGAFAAYAAYFSRTNGAVRFGIMLPAFNNLVSLCCGVIIFSTVFGTLVENEPTFTYLNILNIMKEAGPASTGLTFTWIPVLYSSDGCIGRILCVLYFICLTFAGLSSMISYIQLCSITMSDFGLSQKKSTIITIILVFFVGAPSAISIDFLRNQDGTWSYGLVIAGLFFTIVISKYGIMKYRKVIVNNFGIGDWKYTIFWIPLILVGCPLICGTLLLSWIISEIMNNPAWYTISFTSIMTYGIEWVCLISLLLGLNFFGKKWAAKIVEQSDKVGYDPHVPNYIETDELIRDAREMRSKSIIQTPE